MRSAATFQAENQRGQGLQNPVVQLEHDPSPFLKCGDLPGGFRERQQSLILVSLEFADVAENASEQHQIEAAHHNGVDSDRRISTIRRQGQTDDGVDDDADQRDGNAAF